MGGRSVAACKTIKSITHIHPRTCSRLVLAAADSQTVLTASSLQQYVAQNASLCNLLGGSTELQVQQLMDGVINMVFKVQGSAGPGQAAIVKQALPYVRAVGESFPLSRVRVVLVWRLKESWHSVN